MPCVLALLGLAACSSAKDEAPHPAPKNDLLGRWQAASVTETYYEAGRIVRQATSSYAPGSFAEYTETEVLTYQGTQLDSRTRYTRRDSVLHLGTSTHPSSYLTIRKLDARQLWLVTARLNVPDGQQMDNTLVYAR